MEKLSVDLNLRFALVSGYEKSHICSRDRIRFIGRLRVAAAVPHQRSVGERV